LRPSWHELGSKQLLRGPSVRGRSATNWKKSTCACPDAHANANTSAGRTVPLTMASSRTAQRLEGGARPSPTTKGNQGPSPHLHGCPRLRKVIMLVVNRPDVAHGVPEDAEPEVQKRTREKRA